MQERIKWIDVVRCFGIFLIYLGHCGTAAGRSYYFVFSHHVALFFLISGCTEAISDEKRIWRTAQKIFRDILLPWFLFAYISIVIHAISTDGSREYITKLLIQMQNGAIRNQFVASSLWFLTCIAVVRMLFAVIKKLRIKFLIVFACFLLYLFAAQFVSPRYDNQPALLFNVDSALNYILYYGIGYVSFPLINKALNPRTIGGKTALLASCVASMAYAGGVFYQNDYLVSIESIPSMTLVYPIIRTLLICWMYFVIAKQCEQVTLFNQIGQNTLYLCGSEYIVETVVASLLGAFGILVCVDSPLEAYCYCGILIVVITKWLVPVEKQILSYFQKLPVYLLKNKENE